MGDSDEEYDRKKRDKFRRERSDYTSERRRGDHDRRSSWREEYSDSRKRTRDDDDDKDGRGGGRYHRGGSSPSGRRGDWSPPSSKRYRREGWESLRDYGPPHGGGMYPMMDRRPPPWMMGGDGHHGGGMPPPGGARGDMMMGFSSMNDSRQRGSTLLTFKQFLSQQDDNIDDAEAIRLYHEYKADFKKKQLHQFFNDHKEEDWLQCKYHPNRVADNRSQYLHNVRNRLNVFDWLSKQSLLEGVPLIVSEGENIVQLMDKAVILMEGGSELDFQSLNIPLQELQYIEKKPSPTAPPKTAAAKKDDNAKKEKPTLTSQDSKGSFSVPELSPEHQKLADQAKQYRKEVQSEPNQDGEDVVSERKRVRVSEDGSSSPDNDERNTAKKPHNTTDSDAESTEVVANITDPPPPPSPLGTPSQSPVESTTELLPDTVKEGESSMEQVVEGTGEVEAPPLPVQPLEEAQQPETGQTEVDTSSSSTKSDEQVSVDNEEEIDKEQATPDKPKPRHLHITKAVYVRHISPQLSATDILEVCKTFPGYLRIAFAEPQPEKGYERRGWVTYSADTKISEVSNKLAAAKIKGVQLNCQVNKDLTRRVKPVLPVTWTRGVVVHDIKQLLKIVEVFDERAQLWQHSKKEKEDEPNGDNIKVEEDGDKVKEEGVKEGDSEQVMEVDVDGDQEENLPESNPLLDVSESLFEISSSSDAKEDKLIKETEGKGQEEEGAIDEEEDEEGVICDPSTIILSSDSCLIKVLDELLWYVRLVHSLDYYNFTHFMEEDHMPHRLGIMSVRPKPPNNSISSEEVAERIKQIDERIAPLLNEKKELNNEEMEKLGQRDQDTELEKFIDANTQKLGENKYLCPLSGKKFRGTDFVRKHIFNKHKAALEEVKSDTAYFNNYLRDPDRPFPLDGSMLITSGLDEGRSKGEESRPPQRWGNSDPMMSSGYHGHHRFERGGSRGQRRFSRPPRGSGFISRGRRRLQNYEDLDAPVDLY